ncbi:glycosyltransferase family 4 protein [Adhaeribacter aquaticus]|uniref:glycosyltransferase family 4 protein n=1 Tax=Adhaeribacter aquaticus TaxID=299567 RepID=UPI0003FF9B1C|nr:glycosyltransferase family 4 protein [Adhaeribacter aquaticus]
MNNITTSRVAVITSCLKGRTIAFEWIATGLRELGFQVLVLNIDNGQPSAFEDYMSKLEGVQYKKVQYEGRSKAETLKVILKVYRELRKFKADVINTHYVDANLVGLLAGKMAGVRKRIYTRHTTTQHYRFESHKVNVNKLFNKISTHIIAISDVVESVLQYIEHVPATKIIKIHHGFDFTKFQNISLSRIESIRRKYGIPDGVPVIGAISRFDEWKGVEYIVEGFKNLLRDFPNAFLVLANAGGVRYNVIKDLLSELPDKSYCEIKYENDVFALLKTFTVFVHVPIDHEIEAYGQVYIEAMAASVPMVCTLSGVANEYIKDGENAIVVNYKDAGGIYQGVKKLIQYPELIPLLTTNAQRDIQARFSKDIMINKLSKAFSKKDD